ncbi:MAG: hypothetical protein HJJLKODD_01698 [Phycisphaerae bacterium]|nr:hypothetical protein [Phycisphaerae bacterium]
MDSHYNMNQRLTSTALINEIEPCWSPISRVISAIQLGNLQNLRKARKLYRRLVIWKIQSLLISVPTVSPRMTRNRLPGCIRLKTRIGRLLCWQRSMALTSITLSRWSIT